MSKTTYETHNWENPILPIIFHTNERISDIFTPNWHENIEILLCISGKGFVKCDAETYDFTPGCIAVINSNSLHSIKGDGQVIYHCLIIGNGFCKENGIDVSNLKFKELIKNQTVLNCYENIVTAICESKKNKYIYSDAVIRTEILKLLIELCKNHLSSESNMQSSLSFSVERVKKTIFYIKNHFSEELTLEKISKYTGISKYHLSREFKSLTGKTVFEMVNLIRCKEAKRLIADGALISEAALACGYENLSYFSRCFKKHIGVLPSKCIQKRNIQKQEP